MIKLKKKRTKKKVKFNNQNEMSCCDSKKSCCAPKKEKKIVDDAEKVHDAVREAYERTSATTQNAASVQKISEVMGYSESDLAVIPQEANLGLQYKHTQFVCKINKLKSMIIDVVILLRWRV